MFHNNLPWETERPKTNVGTSLIHGISQLTPSEVNHALAWSLQVDNLAFNLSAIFEQLNRIREGYILRFTLMRKWIKKDTHYWSLFFCDSNFECTAQADGTPNICQLAIFTWLYAFVPLSRRYTRMTGSSRSCSGIIMAGSKVWPFSVCSFIFSSKNTNRSKDTRSSRTLWVFSFISDARRNYFEEEHYRA